jgi:hypothetical protein
MAIEKLSEFAKTGQKNTDDLNLEVGFVVNRKPARQWFNYLFNMLSLKINEIIESDPVTHSEIIDNLTTGDSSKVASARTVKELQDKKLEASDLKDASTVQKGVVQLNNTLTSTSTTQALTAAQGKVLNNQAFGVGQTWQDVKANRVTGTTYANTTGKPILVVVNTYDGTSIVDSVTLRHKGNDTEGDWSFIVPSGSTYSVTGNIRSWAELR